MMHSNVTLSRLLAQNKWVEDVLRWHGVEPDQVDPRMSVRALCWTEGLDPVRFVRDLQAVGVWDDDLFEVVDHEVDDLWIDEDEFTVEPDLVIDLWEDDPAPMRRRA